MNTRLENLFYQSKPAASAAAQRVDKEVDPHGNPRTEYVYPRYAILILAPMKLTPTVGLGYQVRHTNERRRPVLTTSTVATSYDTSKLILRNLQSQTYQHVGQWMEVTFWHQFGRLRFMTICSRHHFHNTQSTTCTTIHLQKTSTDESSLLRENLQSNTSSPAKIFIAVTRDCEYIFFCSPIFIRLSAHMIP